MRINFRPTFSAPSTFMVLAIELIAAFPHFYSAPAADVGAFALIGLQVLILLTGNYTFFNLLTMALTFFCLTTGR